MEEKKIITKDDEDKINFICKKLKYSITPIQIRNWLENFTMGEIQIALTVLENLKYFTIDDIVYEYNQSLSKLIESIPEGEKIYLHGLGLFGKSGSTMIYFIKQTTTFRKNESRIKILLSPNKLKSQGLKENSYLVLVDDIIGSGRSLIGYYKKEISFQLLKEKFSLQVYILCVAFMQNSASYLSEHIPNVRIFGTGYIKAFASGGSVFGYRPKMLPIRQFCYNYGKGLFSKKNWNTQENEIHPLGFNGSQSLIVFAHSVPNNTLPIIWSTKNGWFPLYPRNPDEKISRSKEFQKDTMLWIGIAYKIGIFKTENSKNIYTKNINYALLAVIKLKRRKSIAPVICQILGITINNYTEIIHEGIKRNLFDQNENLTPNGLKVYSDIQKSIKINYTEEKNNRYNLNIFETYIPKKFLGKT